MKKIELTKQERWHKNYLKYRDKKLAYAKTYRIKNRGKLNPNKKEYDRQYRLVHKEKNRLYQISYRSKNKEHLKFLKHRDYLNNKDKFLLRAKLRYLNNKELCRKQVGERVKIRRKIDNNFKLALFLRRTQHRILFEVKKKKLCSSKDLVGCSIDEFRNHLERQFKEGMNWSNYGTFGWHIDHVKPLSSFNLVALSERLKACHYTNTQPLWAKDNLTKHAKI